MPDEPCVFLSFNAYCGRAIIRIWVNIHKTHRRLNLAPRSLMLYLYIDRVFRTCSTCLHLYPLHFDVKYIDIRIHIIFHENFTQKTISTASIYILQGNSTAAATVGNMQIRWCADTVCLLISGTSFLVTHCPQICVRKEISRPGFLHVNR
jgi:hypothetical protein